MSTASAPTAAADRNLLFGILAVQMDFVSAEQLITGMNSWVLDKRRPLAAHLVDAGALAADTRGLLDAIVEKHIQQHGGSVQQSLAAVSDETIRQGLAAVADSDVQASLGHAAPTSPGDRHATAPYPPQRAPETDERFQLLRPHAAGGLGKVSVARDAALNREVALKELHDRHADDPDSRARFLQEAEITGGLEHPGVVPIYALGQYADGRPYYAMRFIRGESFAQAIERFHREAHAKWSNAVDVLQLRRLLARFLDVCNAIDYAHSRGVLHRDIKPGNIMLGQYGETLVVDWGLAKAMGALKDAVTLSPEATIPISAEPALKPQSGGGSAPTQMGAAIGTPAYMSPEQAAGRLDQLGPPSDVYSLGATLYMLLTGRAPQEDDDLGIVLQRVQRGEFPPPRLIKPHVPRGLEAICLKAMALDPRARYGSGRELADDVEAWLADEPITARPDSARAKAFRWIKNHRTLVTSGAAMVLVALFTLSAFNVQLRVANDREREAKNAALVAQRRAEAAHAEAELQATRNAELVELARHSLQRYETLSQSDLLRSYGMEPLRRDLLEVALNFYATLAAQVGESEQARLDRANALFRMASTYWQLGPVDDAIAAYDKSIARFKELATEHPQKVEYAQSLASAIVSKAELMNAARDAAAAEALLAEARQIIGGMLAREPESRDARIRLAYVHSLDGERLRQLGRLDDAANVFAAGIKLIEGVDPTSLDADASLDLRYRLGRALNQLAALESQALWRFDDARRHFDQAEALFAKLHQEWPHHGDVGHSYVQVLRNSGHLYARQHFYEQAKSAYAKSLEVITQVERQSPGAVHYRREMAEVLHSLGTLHRPLEDGDMSPEALAHLEQARAISGELVAQSPQDVSRLLELARYQSSLGQAYMLRQRRQDADQTFNKALQSLKNAKVLAGDNVDALYTLGQLQYTIAEQLGDVSRHDEALAMLEAAEASLQKLVSLSPRFGEAYLSLWNVFIERSSCYAAENRLVDSVAELDRISDMNVKMQELAEAPWMRAGAQAITTLGRSLRWGRLKQIREGGLNALTAAAKYELAGEQARRLPQITRAAGDHYVAARALAYAAAKANGDDKIADERRQAIVEPLAADAVRQLTLAWEEGYLRRRAGMLSGLLRGGVELSELKAVFEFKALETREDYRKLVKRIETERPPSAGKIQGDSAGR